MPSRSSIGASPPPGSLDLAAPLAEAAGLYPWSHSAAELAVTPSPGLRARLGVKRERVTRHAFIDRMCAPEDRSAFEAALAQAEAGQIVQLDHRAPGKDGEAPFYRTSFAPAGPDRATVLGLSQDISSILAAPELDRRRRNKLAETTAAAHNCIALFDLEGRYLEASTTWQRRFGLKRGGFAGVSFAELAPGSADQTMAHHREAALGRPVISEEELTAAGRGPALFKTEYRPLYGVTGAPLAYTVRATQVHKDEEAWRQAQAYSERLEVALESARAGVFEMDMAAKAFWCSREFVDLVGHEMSQEEAFSPCWPFHYPEDRDYILSTVAAAMAETADVHMEARVVLPGGEVRWIEWRMKVKADANGRRTRVVGFAIDIDARKRQELALIEAERAAHAAAEAKAQFLANMSHEIRTPMNGVLGVLHLLEKEPLSADGQRLLSEAQSCGQMLAQLLNDVIDFSKIEAGRLELQAEPIDPADTLASVARLLRPLAEAKGVELLTRIEGDGGWIMADPVRLRQALFNLIGNAVKFTVKGRIEARLRLSAQGKKRRIRFEIEDTGVGIPLSVQSSLFRRFQQADGSTARRFGGSGLGLAITRALADLMGGEVGFTSSEGQGSTFWIEVVAEKAAGPRPLSQIDDGALEGLRILIVEDNPTNRLVATKMLEALGAEVETANDGVEGVSAVQDGASFDLVLMDVQMPRMDGMEATRTIRALPSPLGSTPIIGLTANALAHQWAEYLAIGMDGVAAKPISPPALISEISRVMAETAATRAA